MISSTLPSIPYSTTVSTSSPVHCRPLYYRPYIDRLGRTVFPGIHRVVPCIFRGHVSREQMLAKCLNTKSSGYARLQQPPEV